MANCKDCGKMLGFEQMRCLYCGGWTAVDKEIGVLGPVSKKSTVMLDQVDAVAIERIITGGVWDEAWGGGIVPSSTTLYGGAAGCGKTTMLLQIASIMAGITGKTSYYFSAEQAPGELKMTVDRLQLEYTDRIRVIREFGVGAEIDESLMKEDPPGMFVLDSISALCGQDKHAALEVTKRYKKVSVKWCAPAILICQMTKENDYAGLNALQHEVDTLMTIGRPDNDRDIINVLLAQYPKLDRKQVHKLIDAGKFEGFINDLRLITPWKNRFGATGRDFPLTMTARGLISLPSLESILGTGAHAFDKPRAARTEGRAASPERPRPTTVIPPPSSEANVIGDSLHPRGPDEIVIDGQKLKRVKPKKKKKGLFFEGIDAGGMSAMPAIAGEALKKTRPAVARTAEGKRAAAARRKVEKSKKKEARP